MWYLVCGEKWLANGNVRFWYTQVCYAPTCCSATHGRMGLKKSNLGGSFILVYLPNLLLLRGWLLRELAFHSQQVREMVDISGYYANPFWVLFLWFQTTMLLVAHPGPRIRNFAPRIWICTVVIRSAAEHKIYWFFLLAPGVRSQRDAGRVGLNLKWLQSGGSRGCCWVGAMRWVGRRGGKTGTCTPRRWGRGGIEQRIFALYGKLPLVRFWARIFCLFGLKCFNIFNISPVLSTFLHEQAC